MEKTLDTNNMEKIQKKITYLLNITVENGATENEALMAMLKARELMAKYDMYVSETSTTAEDFLTEGKCNTSNDIWRTSLAGIISKNFCCKVYTSGNNVVFYGFKRHCETACKVFNFLYEFGRKRASETVKELKSRGYAVTGIKNQFYLGFLQGVKSALDEQSRTLVVVTPTEVETSYAELCENKGLVRKKVAISYRKNTEAYDSGYSSGRQATARKQIGSVED